MCVCMCVYFNPHLSIYLLILEKRRGERNICVREKHWSVSSCTCLDQIEPAAQVCALTGNWTLNFLVCGTMPQPTEPPGQGLVLDILKNQIS